MVSEIIKMNFERWQSLMTTFGFHENKETWLVLTKAYSESHRYYHTKEHIAACLSYLDKTQNLAIYPHEVELALWFHDVIYLPRKSNNELESAKWASAFLIQNKASQEVVDRIFNLIMATLHNAPASTADEALLVDIDLSILGAPESVYDEFEQAIRKEYKWVPYFLYKKKRKEVLQHFLARERIYTNSYFFELFETQARKNLTTALVDL